MALFLFTAELRLETQLMFLPLVFFCFSMSLLLNRLACLDVMLWSRLLIPFFHLSLIFFLGCEKKELSRLAASDLFSWGELTPHEGAR